MKTFIFVGRRFRLRLGKEQSSRLFQVVSGSHAAPRFSLIDVLFVINDIFVLYDSIFKTRFSLYFKLTTDRCSC